MGPTAVISTALHQLDSMYGKPCLLCAQHKLCPVLMDCSASAMRGSRAL